MASLKCVYVGTDPMFVSCRLKSALWDQFDVVKGTVRIQFDDLALAPFCYGRHEVLLSDVILYGSGDFDESICSDRS